MSPTTAEPTQAVPARRDAASARRRLGGSITAGAGLVLGGIALLASSVTGWVRSGSGSSLHGLDLADRLRAGAFAPSWGPWAAAGIYGVAVFGAVSLAVISSRSTVLNALRALVSGSIVAVLGWLAWSGRFTWDLWSAGPWLVASGGLSIFVASIAIGRLGGRR